MFYDLKNATAMFDPRSDGDAAIDLPEPLLLHRFEVFDLVDRSLATFLTGNREVLGNLFNRLYRNVFAALDANNANCWVAFWRHGNNSELG